MRLILAAILLALSLANIAEARIVRSHAAKLSFCSQTGYSGCHRRGYVVDHVVPLACGGADAPFNMQWQTTADAKAKDKLERKGCKR